MLLLLRHPNSIRLRIDFVNARFGIMGLMYLEWIPKFENRQSYY